MVLGRKPGIIRRPVEYVLVLIIISLIILLVWANLKINSIEDSNQSPAVRISQPSNQLDIHFIAESSLSEESAADSAYDKWELESIGSIESAADAIGGVYDETTY